MRKIIKSFNQFVRNRINEDLETIETPESEELEAEDGFESTEDNEFDDESNIIDDIDDEGEDFEDEYKDDEEEVSPDYYGEEEPGYDSGDNEFEGEEGEEEEGHEYEGTIKMDELAKMLGAKVINNEINYNGHVIHYYSETEKFHIGKQKFETPEEVVEYLKSEE